MLMEISTWGGKGEGGGGEGHHIIKMYHQE